MLVGCEICGRLRATNGWEGSESRPGTASPTEININRVPFGGEESYQWLY